MREGQSNSATLGLPQVDKAVYSVAIIFTMSSFPFSRPSSPAAKCLHLIRLRELTSRSELVKDTHLSQPTITRAVAALVKAGYVTERTDLTRALHAGIAVGTLSTYIALFDLKGRTVRSVDIDVEVADESQDDFIQRIMATLNRLTTGVSRPLATVGVTTSGSVTGDGEVYAPNLGWRDAEIGAQLREQFSVPVVVTSAAAAIVGSEIQSSPSLNDEAVLALFADDSIGCALATEEGVLPIAVTRDDLTTQGLIDAIGEPSIRTLRDAVTDSAHKHTTRGALDDRAHQLGELAAQLSSQHAPSTIVVAGSAFIDDPLAPAPFARSVRGAGIDVELRMIPTHREVVRDIARAVALDFVLREPLAVASP